MVPLAFIFRKVACRASSCKSVLSLTGYIWSEQGVLTSIDADNQGSAVFVDFQSGSVFSGHGLLLLIDASLSTDAAYRARNSSALGTKSAWYWNTPPCPASG